MNLFRYCIFVWFLATERQLAYGRPGTSLLRPGRETTTIARTPSFPSPPSIWQLLRGLHLTEHLNDGIKSQHPAGPEAQPPRETALTTSSSLIAPQQLVPSSQSRALETSISSSIQAINFLLEDFPTLFGAEPIHIGRPPPMVPKALEEELPTQRTAAPPRGYIRIHREADPPTIFSSSGSGKALPSSSPISVPYSPEYLGSASLLYQDNGSTDNVGQTQGDLQHASDALDEHFLASVSTPAGVHGAQGLSPYAWNKGTPADNTAISREEHIAALLEAAWGPMTMDSQALAHVHAPSDASLDEALRSTFTPASHPVHISQKIMSMTARLHQAALLEDRGTLQTSGSIINDPTRRRTLNRHASLTASVSRTSKWPGV
ncbi:hypothetical protein WJX74_008667 [Apatococcus lobatus]|uniref:Uncharacterized protein n=2 Tax=Apatococcus TaxID=904362 RepID=A0AAW1SQC7_9CHLO